MPDKVKVPEPDLVKVPEPISITDEMTVLPAPEMVKPTLEAWILLPKVMVPPATALNVVADPSITKVSLSPNVVLPPITILDHAGAPLDGPWLLAPLIVLLNLLLLLLPKPGEKRWAGDGFLPAPCRVEDFIRLGRSDVDVSKGAGLGESRLDLPW